MDTPGNISTSEEEEPSSVEFFFPILDAAKISGTRTSKHLGKIVGRVTHGFLDKKKNLRYLSYRIKPWTAFSFIDGVLPNNLELYVKLHLADPKVRMLLSVVCTMCVSAPSSQPFRFFSSTLMETNFILTTKLSRHTFY